MAQSGSGSSEPSRPSSLNAFYSAANYDQARQHLRYTRARLSHTIQDYLSACELIQKTCDAPNNPSAEREQALLAIDAELVTFVVEESTMQQARNVLADTRNRSKMVAPVYSLPSEVLARIFCEAACHCTPVTNYKPVPAIANPIALSGVCRQWRRVAHQHRPLWTHVDLVVGRKDADQGYPSSAIWLERTKDAFTYVNIRQYRSLPDGVDENDDPYDMLPDDHLHPAPMVGRLLDFLSALVPQICSISLVLHYPAQYIVTKLLDLWSLSHSTTDRAKALRLHSHLELPTLDFQPTESAFGDSLAPRIRRYKRFFESLEVLHLHNVIPSWLDLSLCNLTDLRLETGEEWLVTEDELASLLTSCPKLEYLSLDCLDLSDYSGPTRHRAALNELRILRVRDVYEGFLVEAALAIIMPGLNSLTMSVAAPFGSDARRSLVAMQSFTSRSNVKTLYISSNVFGHCFASQLGPFPRVETLVLNQCNLSNIAWGYRWTPDVHFHPIESSHLINPELVLWPDLRNLYLNRCTVDKEHARQLLSLHRIQIIYLWNCFDSNEPAPLRGPRPPAPEEYWHFLSDVVPKVLHFNGGWDTWPSLLH